MPTMIHRYFRLIRCNKIIIIRHVFSAYLEIWKSANPYRLLTEINKFHWLSRRVLAECAATLLFLLQLWDESKFETEKARSFSSLRAHKTWPYMYLENIQCASTCTRDKNMRRSHSRCLAIKHAHRQTGGNEYRSFSARALARNPSSSRRARVERDNIICTCMRMSWQQCRTIRQELKGENPFGWDNRR